MSTGWRWVNSIWGIPLTCWQSLAEMNPGLWSLVVVAPVVYEVWKDTRTIGAAQPCDFQVRHGPI